MRLAIKFTKLRSIVNGSYYSLVLKLSQNVCPVLAFSQYRKSIHTAPRHTGIFL